MSAVGESGAVGMEPSGGNPPPPSNQSDPGGGSPPAPASVFITRTTLVRAALAVVAAGGLVGLGFFLGGSNTAPAAATAQSSSPPAAAAAPASQSHTSATVTTASTSATVASTSSGLDPCVIGTWKGVTQIIPAVVGEPAEFTGPGPQQVTLKQDSTGSTTYGSGVTFGATVNSQAWTEVVTGGATYSYQTGDGQLLFSNAQGSGTPTLYVDGVKNVSAPLTAATSVKYICSGNSLKLCSLTGTGSTELTRTG